MITPWEAPSQEARADHNDNQPQQSAKPVTTARRTRTAPGDWPTGSHSGRLGVMCKTIPTYYLYGLDAIPADVIVQGDGGRVVERGSGRTLVEVRRESDTRKQAGVQSDGPNLVRRESAPARIIAELYCPVSPSLPEFQRHDIDAASYGRINNCNTRPADDHIERVEGPKPARPFKAMGQVGPRDLTVQIVRGILQAMTFRTKLRPMYGDWLSDPPPTGHRPANAVYRATVMSPG